MNIIINMYMYTLLGNICAENVCKAINTTVGKTNYTVAVVCSPYIISDVKASLMDCGATEVELGFVHLKDRKKR